MGIKRNALFFWGFLAAALLVVMQARAATIQVTIDTSATGLGLSGQNWDLAFDLTDSNPQPNEVSISGFAITGGSLTGALGYPILDGNVTGDLSVPPGIVKLVASSPVPGPGPFFNEYLDNATLGMSITFILEITGNMDSGFDPDAFAFFFVNAAGTFPTSDPTGADALFVYSIGNADQPTPYCPVDISCLRVTPVILAAPEPSALVLAMAGLLALGVGRCSRKRRLRS